MKEYLTESYTREMQAFSSAFDCGNDNLNYFLKSSLALDLNYGKTYVLLNNARNRIVGYYCLTTGLIEQDGVKIGGSVHIRDFALDKKYQGIVQYELPNGDIHIFGHSFHGDNFQLIAKIIHNITPSCFARSFIKCRTI